MALPGATLEMALGRADQWRMAFAGESVESDNGAKVRCTVSIGVAEHWPVNETIAETMRRADLALYEAKRGGRDRVVARAPLEPGHVGGGEVRREVVGGELDRVHLPGRRPLDEVVEGHRGRELVGEIIAQACRSSRRSASPSPRVRAARGCATSRRSIGSPSAQGWWGPRGMASSTTPTSSRCPMGGSSGTASCMRSSTPRSDRATSRRSSTRRTAAAPRTRTSWA